MLAKRHLNIGALLLGNFIKLKFYCIFKLLCTKIDTDCAHYFIRYEENLIELIPFIFRTTFLLTLFSQVMVDVQFPFIVYRKNQGLQIRWFSLFKLFPVGD